MSNIEKSARKAIMESTQNRIDALREGGQIKFPENYSPQNALQAAMLKIAETKDKNDKPVLEACTEQSISSALLDTVVQGLNPGKAQCYYIAYGRQLTCMRSYMGDVAVAKRVNPYIKEIPAQVVWEGDKFDFTIEYGKFRVNEHKPSLNSIDSKQPKAGYAMVILMDGSIYDTCIMTWEEIKEAWKMSPVKPITAEGEVKKESTHWKFMQEMTKKTVIHRICKPIINTSSDEFLYRSATRADEIQAHYRASVSEAETANNQMLDVEPDEGDNAPENGDDGV